MLPLDSCTWSIITVKAYRSAPPHSLACLTRVGGSRELANALGTKFCKKRMLMNKHLKKRLQELKRLQ